MRAKIARWRRRYRPKGGRLGSPGHDHERGHLEYVAKMDPWAQRWLRTKPFMAPPNEELGRCLHSFAHIVDRLGLENRAQVLDVGCGPGWLSEFLARCGYWVTGIDVAPDMVSIAGERARAIEGPVGEQLQPFAEFHALHVTELPWEARFDACILYDTLHHFDDELETLRALRRSLVPGGRMYIHEGVRPEPGSDAERELVEEMREHGTLESPFDPDYLLAVVERAGFEEVRRFVEIDRLFDLEDPDGAVELVTERLAHPDTNTIVAVNPLPASEQSFGARIVSAGPAVVSDGEVVVSLAITNTGRSYWPEQPLVDGTVTVGAFFRGRDGGRSELPRTLLPAGVSPGETVSVEVRVPRSAVDGNSRVTVDLVREGIAWFEELGSEPLEIELPAG